MKMMVIDSGAPVPNAGEKWLEQYFEDYGIDFKTLKRMSCYQVFKFGSSKFVSKEIIEVPIRMKDTDGNYVSFVVPTFSLIGADTPFLLGKTQMKNWNAMINLGQDQLEVYVNENGKKTKRVFKMTKGNHSMIELHTESNEEQVVNFVDKNWSSVTDYKGVKKVHEVHGHKSAQI